MGCRGCRLKAQLVSLLGRGGGDEFVDRLFGGRGV